MAGDDRLTPAGKRLFKELDELTKLQVRVGYQAGAASGEGGGASIVDIAAWNELGTEHSPPRPFLRQSVDKNMARITALCKEQLTRVVKGEATARDALSVIGNAQVRLILEEMKSGDFAPNAPITIEGGWMWRDGKAFFVKGKGSRPPLINTGRLRQSLHFVIEDKKGDG